MLTIFLACGPELSQVLNGAGCHLHTVSQWEAVSWEPAEEAVLVGTQRGMDEKEEVEEEEAFGSSHGKECAITASPAQTSLPVRREWENVILVSGFRLIPRGGSFWAGVLGASPPLQGTGRPG